MNSAAARLSANANVAEKPYYYFSLACLEKPNSKHHISIFFHNNVTAVDHFQVLLKAINRGSRAEAPKMYVLLCFAPSLSCQNNTIHNVLRRDVLTVVRLTYF